MITLIKKKGINPNTKEVLYYPQWTRQNTVSEKELAKRMSRGSSYSTGEAMGVMMDFPAYIMDELMDGNAVRVEGLGLFKLRVSGKSHAEREKVTSAGVQTEIVFEPAVAGEAHDDGERAGELCAELLARMTAEAMFKFVERPTAEGEQDAADGEETPETEPEPEPDEDEGGLAG